MDKKALLIIDMSNDFVHENGTLTAGAPAQKIVQSILNSANEFIGNEDHVFICMDEHIEEDEHFKLWPAHNIKGTWGQQLYGDLQVWYETNQNNPLVHFIPKPEYDAFHETNLTSLLREVGVSTVCLTGVCTDICVFLTAYGAYKERFKLVVYKDQTATFTENHESFLEQMKTVFLAEIV
ncbi:MAG: cysteine hydrolase [Bacillales bacterium]|jgi:nicotinamidase-related amidase|nr:cysteine hydrolase [Bacillales bacterium]